MRRRVALPALAGLALSGCVAAVIPLAAGGVIGKRQLEQRRAARAYLAAIPADEAAPAGPAASGTLTLLPAGSMLPPPGGASTTPAAVPQGTGWRGMLRNVAGQVVSGDETIKRCAGRPPAILLDAGVASAGAVDRDAAVVTLNAMRTMGIAVVFAGEPGDAAAIVQAGLGAVTVGDTLVARGTAPGYCVLATGGAGDAVPASEGATAFALGGAQPLVVTAAATDQGKQN